MTIRELHPSEFYKLADNEWLEPKHRPIEGVTRVVVAEDEAGKIQGFAFVQFVPHVEPVWVADKHRFGTVAARLFERARGLLSGKGGFITHATNEQHGNYLTRLGLVKRENWQVFDGRV